MRKVEVYEDSRKEKLIAIGQFHQFGVDCFETNEGVGNWSTAIVELEDGSVITPMTNEIKFVKEELNTPSCKTCKYQLIEEPHTCDMCDQLEQDDFDMYKKDMADYKKLYTELYQEFYDMKEDETISYGELVYKMQDKIKEANNK